MIKTDTVIEGDCELILKEFPDKFCQLIFTSPVYANIANKYNNGYKGPPPDKYSDWMIPKIHEFFRCLKDDGSFVLNIDSKVENGFESIYVYELVCRIVKETGFKLFDTLIWHKGKFLPIRNRFGNQAEFLFLFVKQRNFKFNIDAFRNEYSPISIQRMKRPIKTRYARTQENQELTDNYKPWSPNPKGALPGNIISCGSESQRVCDSHVACFPVKLPEKFILGLTDENDICLDPFCGTGSALVAAKKNNRSFVGIDISEEYVNFSLDRLSKV
jgi:DNA modification methylase